jgi:hypothetical protein
MKINRAGENGKAKVISSLAATSLTCLALALLATGCTHLETGLPMTAERTSFLQDGTTTRHEIVDNLGRPTIESTNYPALAYTWERHREGIKWTFFNNSGDVTDGVRRRWLFCVELGKDEKVIRHAIIRQESEDSPTEALDHWVSVH